MTKQITNIAQFKPLPKSRGRIGMYICEAPNTTEAYAGEYSVRITFNGCAINAKTTLAINSCDNLYIKAFNPLTNVETNKLIRKPNVAAKNEYLILQVETLDGKIIKTLNYTWDPPSGVTLGTNQNEPYKVQTDKLGRYTVQASSANGTSCPLSIDIFAEPCTIVGDAFNCNSTGGSTIDAGQTDLANLAVGDEFTTSDYTIVVTEASKTGTTFSGKGKLIFNFLKISNTLALQIPISVTFTGIKINQCYQLYNGSVITEYDPSWGSVVSADQIKNQLSGVYTQIKDLLVDPTANIVALQNKIKDLRAARADLANADFTAEYKAEQLAALDAAISGMVCLVGEPPATGSRMSVTLNSSTCDAATVGASIDAAEVAGVTSQINPYFGDVFDENGNYLNTTNGGVYPRIIIKTENGKFILITEWKIKEFSKAEGLNKICLKYFDELSLDRSKLYNGKISIQAGGLDLYNFPSKSFVVNPDNKLWWSIVDKKMLVVYLAYPDGLIGHLPSYISNIKSMIYHEYLHLAGFDSHQDKTIEGIEKHINVYDKQINLSGYILCTVDFKVKVIEANLKNLIQKVKQDFNNLPKYNYWINYFKKQGYDFSR
jgi:hypothetical protein